MLFLFSIGDLLSDLGGTLLYWLLGFLRVLAYFVCSHLYKLIISVYDIFTWVCNVQLLEIEEVQSISTRVGMILGIIMLFYVSFQIIQMVVDPDKITNAEKGVPALIKKVLLVIVMLGTSTFAFTFLQEFQMNVIESGIINRLLLPKGTEMSDNSSFGRYLSADLFLSFYRLNATWESANESNGAAVTSNESNGRYVANNESYDCEKDYKNLRANIIGTVNSNGLWTEPDFSTQCVNKWGEDSEKNNLWYMNFDILLCLGVGIYTLWTLFNYTISVGVRAIQLSFLQIISPMAIIGYLAPGKDNIFSKWSKKYMSTYFDVFIRIAIINFACYLIAVIMDSFNDKNSLFWTSMVVNRPIWDVTATYIKVVMILAIFQFAKKAPQLLKDLLPAGAGSGIGYGVPSRKQFLENTPVAPGVAAVAAGRAVGNAANAVGKFMDKKPDKSKVNNLQKELDDLNNMPNFMGKDQMVSEKEEELAQAKKDYRKAQLGRMKWLGRAVTGAASGAVTGAAAGAKTKTGDEMKAAITKGTTAAKNKYKLRDAGYGSSVFGLATKKGQKGAVMKLQDTFVRKPFGRDTNVELMTSGAELQATNLTQKIHQFSEDHPNLKGNVVKQNGQYSIFHDDGSFSSVYEKNGDYYYKDTNGNERDVVFDEIQYANLDSDLKTVQSRQKSFSRENEKSKKD